MTLKARSALPEIAQLIDTAPATLKDDISRIKKLLADPDAILPVDAVAFTLQEAHGALALLATHAHQLSQWQKDNLDDGDRLEVCRLQALIPEIRPLVQRLISLATALDARARTGATQPRKKWRH